MSVCDDCPARISEHAKPPKIGMEISGCWLNVWNSFPYRDQPDKPPDTCPDAISLKVKYENQEMVLVSVPKEVDRIVGWKNQSYGPIQFDSTKGTMEYNPEGISGTTTVWFWVRSDSVLDFESEDIECETCRKLYTSDCPYPNDIRKPGVCEARELIKEKDDKE